MNRFWWVLSNVLNAPTTAFFLFPFVLIYKTSEDFAYSIIWTLLSLLFALVILLVSFVLVRKGVFINMDVSTREQRTKLFILLTTTSLLYLGFILLFNGPRILVLLGLGSIAGISVLALITRKIKVSIHLMVFTAFAVSVALLFRNLNSGVLILVPLLAISRVKLNRHTQTEVALGTLVGVLFAVIFHFIGEILDIL